MIYLIHGAGKRTRIACCETEATAARLLADGWERVSCDDYVDAWEYLDAVRLGEMKREIPRPPVLAERVVGEVW
jgi:hypothetical protein